MSRSNFACVCMACILASLTLAADARAEQPLAETGTLEYYAEQTQLFILRWVPLACVVGIVVLCVSLCVFLSYIREGVASLGRHVDGLAARLSSTLTSSLKEGTLSQIPLAMHKIEGVLSALGKQVENQEPRKALDQLITQLKELSDAVRDRKASAGELPGGSSV